MLSSPRTEPAKSIFEAGLKIDRAGKHLCDLTACISEYLARDPYHLAFGYDQKGGISLFMEQTVDHPVEIPLLIGDCVHNLKAALDYIWTGVHRAALETRKIDRVYFPIGNTRDDVMGRCDKVAGAFPGIKEFIADVIRPYSAPQGIGGFKILNHLDRADKHNFLTIAISEVDDGHMIIHLPGVMSMEHKGNRIYTDRRTNLISVHAPLSALPYVEQILKPSSEIVFSGINEIVPHSPVIPTLNSLLDITREAVKSFQEYFI
jgi:hypothetical protein